MNVDLESIIQDLTSAAQPPPLTLAEPATMSAAKRLFDPLKKSGIYPSSDAVYNLLIKNHWEEKHAKYFLKRFAKYFS